jgi:class 3 adenylate cyclase
MMSSHSSPYQSVVRIFAVAQALGATRACAARGDAAMFQALQRYYTLVTDNVRRAGGTVIKFMGNGALLLFPADSPDVVVEVLRVVQSKGTDLWRNFDEACSLQVKVEIGPVVEGLLGPPGDERLDIIGGALNSLIKTPWDDFQISSELAGLLE